MDRVSCETGRVSQAEGASARALPLEVPCLWGDKKDSVPGAEGRGRVLGGGPGGQAVAKCESWRQCWQTVTHSQVGAGGGVGGQGPTDSSGA